MRKKYSETKLSENKKPVEGFLDSSEGKIHYLDWGGSGIEAHFLHANGFCAGTYLPFIKYLTDDFRIVASDIRGHGDSVYPNMKRIRHWSIFSEDLKEVIEQTMSPPIIGIGHSMGAATTFIASARYPHLFSCIIMIDPVIFPRRMLCMLAAMKIMGIIGLFPYAKRARQRRKSFRSKKAAFEHFAGGRGAFKTWQKEFIHAYSEWGLVDKGPDTSILKCDPEVEAQIFETPPSDIWRYGSKIRCPALVIRGGRSDVFYPDAAERLRRIVPDCEIKSISNSGHFVPMEKPEECAEVIAGFIKNRRVGKTIVNTQRLKTQREKNVIA